MPTFGLRDSVCGALLRVSLADGRGRLPDVGALAVAARGALLIDLVRTGRLTRDDDGLQIDTTPSGCMAADQLAREVQQHRDRKLEQWLRRGAPHLDAIVWELVHTGCWRGHGPAPMRIASRFDDLEPDATAAIRAAARSVLGGAARPLDEGGAAFVLVYAALQRPSTPRGPRPSAPDWVWTALGELDWIVRDVVTELDSLRELVAAAAIAGGGVGP